MTSVLHSSNSSTITLQEFPAPQAFFAMFGRFFATYAMNTGFQFSVEVKETTCSERQRPVLREDDL